MVLVGMVRNIGCSKASRVAITLVSRYELFVSTQKSAATKSSVLYYDCSPLRRSFSSKSKRRRRGNDKNGDSVFVKNTRNAAFGMVLCLYGTIAYLRETYGGNVPYSWQMVSNVWANRGAATQSTATQSTTTLAAASDPTTNHS